MAEEMIVAGRVAVNGIKLDPKNLGLRVDPLKDRVTVDGKNVLESRPKPLLFSMHKLKGELIDRAYSPAEASSKGSKEKEKDDFRDRLTLLERARLMGLPDGLIAIGGLDFNATGLQLLTNDPALARLMEHPSNASTFAREYRLTVYGRHIDRAIRALKAGGYIQELGKIAPAESVEVLREKAKGVSEEDDDSARKDGAGWATGAGSKKKEEEDKEGDDEKEGDKDRSNKRRSDDKDDEDLPAKTVFLRVVLTEGNNRMLRGLFGHFGCVVNDCERAAFGPFRLSGIPRGAALKVHIPGWLKKASREIVGLKEPKISAISAASTNRAAAAAAATGAGARKAQKPAFQFDEEKSSGSAAALEENVEDDLIVSEGEEEDADDSEGTVFAAVFEKDRRKSKHSFDRQQEGAEEEEAAAPRGRRNDRRDSDRGRRDSRDSRDSRSRFDRKRESRERDHEQEGAASALFDESESMIEVVDTESFEADGSGDRGDRRRGKRDLVSGFEKRDSGRPPFRGRESREHDSRRDRRPEKSEGRGEGRSEGRVRGREEGEAPGDDRRRRSFSSSSDDRGERRFGGRDNDRSGRGRDGRPSFARREEPRDDRREEASNGRGGEEEKGSAGSSKRDFYSRKRRADGGSMKAERRSRLSPQDAAFNRGEERAERRDRRGGGGGGGFSSPRRSERGSNDRGRERERSSGRRDRR